MLAVPSSRIILRSCPEGTSGQGMSDTKALTFGPVIFVVLMGNARNCRRLVVPIQPEMVKFSQLGCILCHWLTSGGTKVIILNLWSGPCLRRLCAESCCLCYKLIYRYNDVLNVRASSQISTLNRSWPGDDVQSAQNCVLPLLPSLLSNGFITHNCLLREKLSQ